MVSINKEAGGELEEDGGDKERDAILKVKTFLDNEGCLSRRAVQVNREP